MGQEWSMITQLFPPTSRFSQNDVPDLSGKVVIVTGGNTGIGKEITKILLTRNAKVYIACRSREKAESAIEHLRETTNGKEAVFLELDLASLASVRRAAEEFIVKEPQLNILFNNAGVMRPPLDQLTEDSYDLQFGTNVLGHFFFTKLLVPVLLAAASPEEGRSSRIVTTSSLASYLGKLEWDNFGDGSRRRKMSSESLYNQSKLGNIVVAREFARRYGHEGIISSSVNPGSIKTDLHRYVSYMERRFLRFFLYPVEYGSLTPLYAGTSRETTDSNGKFFVPWAREGKPKKAALDPETGERLWNWCEEQVMNK